MTHPEYKPGDWVWVRLPSYVEDPVGGVGPEAITLLARISHSESNEHGPFWRLDRGWDGCFVPFACLPRAYGVDEWMRHATPDEIALACLTEPENWREAGLVMGEL